MIFAAIGSISDAADSDVMTFDEMHLMEEGPEEDFEDCSDEFYYSQDDDVDVSVAL